MHGCFWHRHPGCRHAYEVDEQKHPAWLVKFATNVERDKKDIRYLASHGWRTLVVWECALDAKKRRTRFLPEVLEWIENDEKYGEIPSEPPLKKNKEHST